MRSLLDARDASRTAAFELKRIVRSQAGRAGASQPPAGSSMAGAGAEPSLPGAALYGRAHTSGHEPAEGDDTREVPGAAAALTAGGGGGALPIGRWDVEPPEPPPPAAEGEGRRLQQDILPSLPARTDDDDAVSDGEILDREILDDLERAIYEEEGVLAWPPPPPPLGGSPPPPPDGAPPPPPGRSTEQLAGEFDLSRAMP